jgi:hypothetical protein
MRTGFPEFLQGTLRHVKRSDVENKILLKMILSEVALRPLGKGMSFSIVLGAVSLRAMPSLFDDLEA